MGCEEIRHTLEYYDIVTVVDKGYFSIAKNPNIMKYLEAPDCGASLATSEIAWLPEKLPGGLYRVFLFYRANIHTHIHRDKVIAILAPITRSILSRVCFPDTYIFPVQDDLYVVYVSLWIKGHRQ